MCFFIQPSKKFNIRFLAAGIEQMKKQDLLLVQGSHDLFNSGVAKKIVLEEITGFQTCRRQIPYFTNCFYIGLA
jgi:hypothetical protein